MKFFSKLFKRGGQKEETLPEEVKTLVEGIEDEKVKNFIIETANKESVLAVLKEVKNKCPNLEYKCSKKVLKKIIKKAFSSGDEDLVETVKEVLKVLKARSKKKVPAETDINKEFEALIVRIPGKKKMLSKVKNYL